MKTGTLAALMISPLRRSTTPARTLRFRATARRIMPRRTGDAATANRGERGLRQVPRSIRRSSALGLGLMEQALRFVETHGVPVVFVYVFLRQLGVPIPGAPGLMMFGAL